MADENIDNEDTTDDTEVTALEMSDDDFLKMEEPADEPTDTSAGGDELTDTEGSGNPDQTGDPEPDADDDQEKDADETLETSSNEDDDPGEPGTDDKPDKDTDDEPAYDADKSTDDNKDDSTDKDKTVLPKEVDKSAGFDRLMAPFKANGEVMQVKTIDDARTLMKMGANYSKKMDGIAPHRKTLKLLDKHDLLEPEKLNYVIDLIQKKPEAIRKLLKDSGTDPLDIDLKGDSDYVPEQRTVSDAEIQLDEVLEDIQDSQHYTRTLNVISTEWDQQSKALVSSNPQVIKVINEHMENGLYDQVAAAVAYERRLGKLAGVSDFEAYKQMGDYMNANKLFKATQPETTLQHNPQTTQTEQPTQQPDTNKTDKIAQRKARKAAASSSTSKSKAIGTKANYDPLSMSDEDFLKFDSSSYV